MSHQRKPSHQPWCPMSPDSKPLINFPEPSTRSVTFYVVIFGKLITVFIFFIIAYNISDVVYINCIAEGKHVFLSKLLFCSKPSKKVFNLARRYHLDYSYRFPCGSYALIFADMSTYFSPVGVINVFRFGARCKSKGDKSNSSLVTRSALLFFAL